ncbi:uncharacterized protein N7529_006857 [Penicillium soppii]|jgi:mannosyltransferase OCH1-like enzyme|uniref:uncharacterized protein n=1 Tax=Penicillium soppii TaxID=69789 RepID=UPI002549BD0F|nr:uncharacterized protein N7529_006857 [Penicillium soppii]KAJ5864941.1 hypothetical protein N7529_006857 [Penicillium soppii]
MLEKNFVSPSLFPKKARRFTHGGLVALCLFIYFCVTRTSHESGENKSYSTQLTSNIGEQFPRKIWQIWKVNPLEFDERDIGVARSWISKNPDYRYEVLTDQNDLGYVETNFGPLGLNRPDIVETYRSLTAPIIKADLLRYLVLYMEGGVYADIDVEALRPVERFIPSGHDESEIDMVIGVEIDEPHFSDHPILGQKSQSFCQWTFMCKPRQPVMMRLVENILHWLNQLSIKQGRPISELQLDFDDVITGTGPSAFTGAILSEMSRATGKDVTWSMFHDISESKVVGGFLVLTVEAFAAGQGHSDSGTHNSRAALVKHHYHASAWPNRHPRFYHPIFGEVERCNWNMDCVRKWDEEASAFAALPQEEQERQIATFQAIGEALKNMEPPPEQGIF